MNRVLNELEIIALRQTTRASATQPWADTLAFAESIEKAVLDKLGFDHHRLTPSVYRVEFEVQGCPQVITVELCRQRDGSDLWAIRHTGNCFGDGGWEYEPMPSGRSDEFLVKYRYPSLPAAAAQIEAAIAGVLQLHS